WHGAGWTFVAWGLWHGVGLVVCRAWQQLGRPLPAVAGWAITMLFVLMGWVMFRANGFATAGSVLASLAGFAATSGTLQETQLLVAAALVGGLVPWANEMKDRVLVPRPSLAFGAAVLAVVCVLEVGRGAPVNFIYFQF